MIGGVVRNIDSLRTDRDFGRVYRVHDSAADRYLVIYKADGTGRFGIVCSKKVGNSVVRHHFARLIREAYRLHKDNIRKDKDIIVVARELAKGQGFIEIERSFITLLKRHEIYEEVKN